MAKKNDWNVTGEMIPTTLEEIMSDRFGRYSKYIIQERALPDARDGLKPVQRRILYSMYHEGNTFDKQHRKSAKTVGNVIGNYHPHGDTSVYDAMVRLSQDWKMRIPLVDMHGNNGSIDDDPAAAMRYTEARLAKISGTMLEDIDKDTVAMAPNFDDTEEEPTVLPTRFPTLLVNGATGIASGYATNIAPHNINEVIEATIQRLQYPESDLDFLMQYISGPDFPTGGIVQGRQGIVDAFKTGRGRVVVRARCRIEDTKSCNQIIITEIPYEVIKCNLIRKMDDIRLSKDIEGIQDVRDESDRNGLRIVIDVKKDIDPQLILNYFYKNTDLQVYYNYNMVAIVNKRPMLLGLIQMLDAFIAHREEVVIRRSRYLLDKMETRCHILEGLMKAVSIMDEIIQIIRSSKDKSDAKSRLEEEFLFTPVQSEAIVTLRLYRLTSTDVRILKEEFAQLVNEMEKLKTILENKNVLHSEMIKELREIKDTYSSERRTEIHDEVEEVIVKKEDMIVNERVMITVSKDGYLKRVSLRSYQASDNSPTGIKESDDLIGTLEVDTLDTLLLFTNKGNYGYLPVYQIMDAKWKDVGNHLSNFMKCEAEEKIINAVAVKNFETDAFIVTISESGYIKKTQMNQWPVQRNNKLMTAMKLKANDAMMKAFVSYRNEEVILITQNGYCSRYGLSLVPSTNTKSQGVKAINLAKEDVLATACVVNEEKSAIAILDDKGAMKRIKCADISNTSRPVKGEMVCKKIKSNPYKIRDVICVSAYDTLCFMDPEVQLLACKDIPLMSKDATFSTPLVLKKDWFLVKGIEEVKIVDMTNEPEDFMTNTVEVMDFDSYQEVDEDMIVTDLDEEVHEDFEMLHLFDEEDNQ